MLDVKDNKDKIKTTILINLFTILDLLEELRS